MTARNAARIILSGLVLALSAGAAGATAPAASAQEVSPLIIGSKIPELTLRTADGDPYDLNAAIEGKPTILVFYRGGW